MGRTRVSAKKKKTTAAASPKKTSLFEQLVAVNKELRPAFDRQWEQGDAEYKLLAELSDDKKSKMAYKAALAARESRRADEKRERKERKSRKAVEAILIMGSPPPYTPGSALAQGAVEAIEQELLHRRHHKHGCAATNIHFRYHVQTIGPSGQYSTVPIPGWPNPWPKEATPSIVKAYSKLCMKQIVAAFVAAHPDFLEPSEAEDGYFPLIEMRSDNSVSFEWAEEK